MIIEGSDIIIEASDIIDESAMEQYKKELKVIGHQLFLVANNLIIFEKILLFRLDLFSPLPEDQTFWQFTRKAYYDSIVLLMSELYSTSGQSACNLKKFTRRLCLPAKAGGFRKNDLPKWIVNRFEEKIDEADFRKDETVPEKIKTVRDKRIAHLDKKAAFGQPDDSDYVPYRLSLNELRGMFDLFERYFQVLAFEVYHVMPIWSYGGSARTDLDRILGDLVRRSHWFEATAYPSFEGERQEDFKALPERDRHIILEWADRLGIAHELES